MKVDVLLGLQWGDEGKGKIVDVLTPNYDVVARFQGGPNAGHSLEFENQKFVLHTIPSGIFRENTVNLIGNGVVLDPVIFKEEIDKLKEQSIDLTTKLLLSKKTHLILPTHRALDTAAEAAKGKTKIGSTLKGIGPTYMDKTGRNGLRIGDILSLDFIKKYTFLKEKHKKILKSYNFELNIEAYEKLWFQGIELLKKFQIVDGEYFINEKINAKQKVLAEGAQGTLLDIEYGSYPYVTSSNTISAGACTGLGVAPKQIGEVFGIFKAYCTRVGSGPFPTELFDETAKKLAKQGNEVGATTGRARRCGWLDLPALKYAIMVNGVTQLIITKADVMDNFDSIKIAVAYRTSEGVSKQLPYNVNDIEKPVYQEFKGWKTDLSACKKRSDFPQEFLDFLEFIETETGVPITIISVGPARSATILLIKNTKTLKTWL